MNIGKTIFSQLMDFIPSYEFQKCVDRYSGNYKVKVFPIPEMTAIDDKTKGDFLKLLGQNKDRLIIFYCGFTQCTRSHNGAMWATKLGYKNVYRHPGGIKAWDQADYPVEKSNKRKYQEGYGGYNEAVTNSIDETAIRYALHAIAVIHLRLSVDSRTRL